MGRTLQTANQIILSELAAFQNFRRALRREDQILFDALFAQARLHTAAISQAAHALPFEGVLLAMNLEQAREIRQLHVEIERLRREVAATNSPTPTIHVTPADASSSSVAKNGLAPNQPPDEA